MIQSVGLVTMTTFCYFRVIQRHLVFVVGLSNKMADADVSAYILNVLYLYLFIMVKSCKVNLCSRF